MQGMPGRKADNLTPAILAMGGAFSPVHSGHLAAMLAAKEHVEAHFRVTVVAGYLACAPSAYCTRKYRGKTIVEAARLDMCNLLSHEPGSFLCETPKAFGSARGCADFMRSRCHTPETRVFIVCGADKAEKRIRGDHVYIARSGQGMIAANTSVLVPAPEATLGVSATLLRSELNRQTLEAALTHVVAAGMLPPCVAAFIAAHPDMLSKVLDTDGSHGKKKGSPRKQISESQINRLQKYSGRDPDCPAPPPPLHGEKGRQVCVVCEGTGLLLRDVCPLCDGAQGF